MQALLKRRLSKVALALVVAGYCSIPSAIAAKEGKLQGAGSDTWQFSGNTGTIQGTVPWITRSAEKVAEADKNHVTVSIDRGERVVNGEGDKQFHIGDKVTVNWAIGDEQGDLDVSNTATKATVVWIRSKQQDGSDATVISGSAGKDSYTLQESDADYYIGIRITPTTTTGDPNVAELLTLNDLSTGSGGGADDDDIPEGPVVDDSIAVAIYDSENASVNLLKTAVPSCIPVTPTLLSCGKMPTKTALTTRENWWLPISTTISGSLQAPVCNWERREATLRFRTAICLFQRPMPKPEPRSSRTQATMAFRGMACRSSTRTNNSHRTSLSRGAAFSVRFS